MDFASLTGAAENRTSWKGIVQIHLWCPNDFPRLWDRIEIDSKQAACIGMA